MNYYYFSEPPESRFSVVENLMGIYLRVCTPLFILVWPILYALFKAAEFNQVSAIQVALVGVIAYLSFFDGLLLTYYRMEARTKAYVTVSILKSTLVIGATALFVNRLDMGTTGGVAAVACGSACGAVA